SRYRNDFLGGPITENAISGPAHKHHLFEADPAITPLAFSAFHRYDHSRLQHLRMVEGPNPADDGLLIRHPDAVTDLRHQQRLLRRISPGVRGEQRLRRIGGRRPWLDPIDDSIDAVAAACVKIALLRVGLSAQNEAAVDADSITRESRAAGVHHDEIARIDDP